MVVNELARFGLKKNHIKLVMLSKLEKQANYQNQ
jgi:hypothetical protein